MKPRQARRRRRFEVLEDRRLLAVVASGFENIDSTDFTLGTAPETARFAGDAFSGRLGVGHLYRTGLFAWMVDPGGTGTIEFSGTADSISMFARLRNNASSGSLTITAYDLNDQVVGTPAVFTNPTAPFQEVTFTGEVARIEAVNTTDQMISIDDFTSDVTALAVNAKPTFTATNPASVLEDAVAQSIDFASFDPGDPSESAQTVVAYSISDVSNPTLFSSQPNLNAAGTLTYTPAPNAFGSSTFVVTVQDDGGTANGGIDTSDPQTFTITVDGINEAPSFELADEAIVSEDAGQQSIAAFARNFDPGPLEDGLGAASRTLHDEGPTGTTNPLSTDNNAPTDLGTLSKGSNIVRGHIDAALTTGDVDVFTFQVASGFQLSGLFVLDYEYVTPPTNPNERNAFLAIDDSATFPFNANELDINQNPFLDETQFIGGTVFGLDDLPAVSGGNILPRAGVITGSGFTGPLPAGIYTIYIQQTGPANTYELDFQVTQIDQKQTVSAYTISNVSDPSLFAAGPLIDTNGDLTFTPATDVFGMATFDVVVQDSGGTANGGVDTSSTLEGTITITSVNDPPIFTAITPPSVLENSEEETVNGFILSFVAGPADEVSQPLLGYQVVEVGNPNLFETQPTIDTFGNLTYKPAADAFGTSTLVVTAQDGGGTDNGGVDTSAPQTFTITVEGINEAPSFSLAGEVTSLEDAGSQQIIGFAGGFDPGVGEDGTSSNTQTLQDEGADGTTNPFSADNNNPTQLGSLSHGSNVVRGYLDAAQTIGDVDVFTFEIDPGFQLDGLFTLEYTYVAPTGNPNERNAFLAINDADTFPYNANELDINQNPLFDESLFLGGTVFGLDDLPEVGGGNILPRAGAITGRGFSGPLPAGTYTFYVQQTGPANTYTLDLRVSTVNNQSVLGYSVSNVSDSSLFASQPQIDAAGNLTYTAADDANGTATFDVVVQDTGGTENGGVDSSAAIQGTITIGAVNDAPTFIAVNPPLVQQNSDEQVIVGFASGFDPGPADEDSQTLVAYSLSNITNPDLFAAAPTIATNGDLSYTPASGVFGTATFDLTVQDSGGTSDGGVDTSDVQTFTITVAQEVVVTWDNPADIFVGTLLGNDQLNAVANVDGVFQYTPTAGTELPEGDNQTLSVTFTPDDSNLTPVTANVEINVLPVVASADFGDAPDTFPVLLADDGARHTVGTLFLGAGVTVDLDGQPTASADADANDDGVSLLSTLIASGSSATASLQVLSSEAGLLDAWVDFNGDGDWQDSGEQIASSISLTVGGNSVSFAVPSDAVAGSAAARFRLSSAGGLGVTGSADDGEVEDYLFAIIDGSTVPAVNVDLPSEAVTVSASNGQINVTGNVELFSAPASQVGALNVAGTDGDDTVVLDVSDESIVPLGGLNVLGNGGSDLLQIVGAGEVDFASTGAIAAERFATIDLVNSEANRILISATAVALLSPVDSVLIVGDTDDAIEFTDPDDWRMGDVSIVDQRFLRQIVNSVSGEIVQAELPTAWQNVIRVSDVNNSGDVTAGDALRIINELSRREFSDGETQDLQNPLEVTSWPGVYFDQNGDNRATALDALRVINDLARIALEGEQEIAPLTPEAHDHATDQAIGELFSTVGPVTEKIVIHCEAGEVEVHESVPNATEIDDEISIEDVDFQI